MPFWSTADTAAEAVVAPAVEAAAVRVKARLGTRVAAVVVDESGATRKAVLAVRRDAAASRASTRGVMLIVMVYRVRCEK
jgi:hypothetical protein